MYKRAIILLNMGGPNSINEVETFLKNMFNDEHILPMNKYVRKFVANMIITKRLSESQEIYKSIGGKSPMTAISFSLTEKLKKMDEENFYTYAFRYVMPYSSLVVKEVMEKGIDEVVLFSMYPQYSTTTTLSSIEDITETLNLNGFKGKISKIERYGKSKAYNDILINNILNKLQEDDSRDIKDIVSEFTLLFSAHSLPVNIIKEGDPYDDELRAQVGMIISMLSERGLRFKKVKVSYQSKATKEEWLSPTTKDTIKELGGEKVIVSPISFTIANSETVYELEMLVRDMAKEAGITKYLVASTPDDTDEFAKFIKDSINI